MPVETLKDALSAGWRVHARCIGGRVDNGKSVAKCVYRAELDLETLVWTRGRNMPVAGLAERMMCPRCGNRKVSLIFEPPPVSGRAAERSALRCDPRQVRSGNESESDEDSAMRDGMYRVQFATNGKAMVQTGVFVLSRGDTISGGDSAFYFMGSYGTVDGEFTATVTIARHSRPAGLPVVFQQDRIRLDLKGIASETSATLAWSSSAGDAGSASLDFFAE